MKRKLFLIFILTLFFYQPFSTALGQESLTLTYLSDMGVDTDGDGLYNYLEIILSATVNETGLYMLQTGPLMNSENKSIPVTTSQTYQLEEGETRLTVRLGGREIRGSGLNPVKVTHIDLISQDYSSADFITDQKLSKEYNHENFEDIPEYKVGVDRGDWMIYEMWDLWESTDPNGTRPINPLRGVVVQIEEINSKKVNLLTRFMYSNRQPQEERISGYLERDSQIYPFLIPSNNSQEFNFNDTHEDQVLGNTRNIGTTKYSRKLDQEGSEIFVSQEYNWDVVTGILTRAWFNTTVHRPNGDRASNNVTLSLYTTNIITQPTSIELNTDLELDEKSNITIQLYNYHGDPLPERNITLKINGDEIDKVSTNTTGQAQIEFTPEKAGNYEIDAIFKGEEGLQPSEENETITLASEGINRNQNLIFAGISVILLIVVAFYILSRTSFL
jgi:hypothetical protein